MTISKDEISAVEWFLSPENAEARRQLKERNEPLGLWLDMVEKRVQEELEAQGEKQEASMKV